MKKILLAGGGTLGPVTPLVALVQASKKQSKDWEFVWIGTVNGPEQKIVTKENVDFIPIMEVKLDRFFSLRNFLVPCKLIVTLIQSFYLLLKEKPDLILSAGGFTAVPIGIAGWCLRIPIILHQQDVELGLSNKILLPFSTRFTSVFKRDNAEVVGNFCREEFTKPETWVPPANFLPNRPLVVLTGGGTGAYRLNHILAEAVSDISTRANVLHITGKGKKVDVKNNNTYHQVEFISTGMAKVLNAATVVVTRAGMGTLTELATLGKASIIIPMPHTHQEANANFVDQAKAAIVLSEVDLTPEQLREFINELLRNKELRDKMSQNMHNLIPDGISQMFKIIDEQLNG